MTATTTSSHVAHNDVEGPRRLTTETKASYKTTELIVFVVAAAAVLIASLVIDNGPDNQGFTAYQGWFLVTLLSIGYMISRGLAKSGSREAYDA